MATTTSSTNPYAQAHKTPSGPGDARPTAMQIVRDEGLVNKLTDKVMLVTGGSSGIGIETVRALHATGARIFMHVRNVEKGEGVRKDILATSEGVGSLELLRMDLDSLESVRAGAAELLSKTDKLNVLVNNAGVRNPPEGKTVDGFETQFGVNHLAPFLLFQQLKPLLAASSTPSFQSRVVNVSSSAHRQSQIHFDNPNLDGIYSPELGYAQSKTANVLMTNEIERLYGGAATTQGVHGLSVHPGGIATGAQRYDDPVMIERFLADPVMKNIVKSTAQGAATTVWAAIAKVWEGKGAVYLEDCRLGQPSENPTLVTGGYKSYLFDADAEEKLWDMSCRMVACAPDGN